MGVAITNEELLSEVNRLRFLDKKHRQISEEAESDARSAKEKAHRLARELRNTIAHICDNCAAIHAAEQCPLTKKALELLDALDHL